MCVPRRKIDLEPEDRARLLHARARVEASRKAYKALLRRLARNYPQSALARALGVSPQAVRDLLKRR